MNQRRARSGFILSELLVVIAIIAVTSAILFPVFARQRDPQRSKETTCLSNMKQLGSGLFNTSRITTKPIRAASIPTAAATAGPGNYSLT